MLDIVPVNARYTIEEYAHIVLDDPKVKALTDKLAKYQKVTDRLIDSFEGLVDQKILVFDDEEELRIGREFNLATEQIKKDTMVRMLADVVKNKDWVPFEDNRKKDNQFPVNFPDFSRISKDKWFPFPTLVGIEERGFSGPRPNKSDIPLLMFLMFANTSKIDSFRNYLLKGSMDLISGAYFAKDMDLAKQKYMVFALFLWIYMEAKTPSDGSVIHFAPHGNDTNEHARLVLVFNMKDYIHYDMWNEDDYERRKKKGVVLRLGLEMYETGNVILQRCGDRPNLCNRTYRVTEQLVNQITQDYIDKPDDPSSTLTKLGTFLPCRHCGKQAYLFAGIAKERLFYCGKPCGNKYL